MFTLISQHFLSLCFKPQKRFALWIAMLGTCLSGIAADLGYTADYTTDTIYSFNLQNGTYTPILTIPGAVDIIDLQTVGRNTLYVLGFNDRNLYAVDLTDNSYRLVTTSPIGDSMELVYSIGIANPQTAYVVGYVENNVYAVDLEHGTSSTLLTLSGNPGLTNIVMSDSTTAYVTGYNDNNLYKIDLNDNTYSLVLSSIGAPGMPALEGLALASNKNLYVVGNMDANVYGITDLETISPHSFLVTPMPVGEDAHLINLAVENGMGYTVNNLGGEIYKINLSNGQVSILTNILSANLAGMTLLPATSILPVLPPQIPVANLSGNNLHLANYFNKNAPQSVVSLFADLNSDLASALEATASTRNACLTYASQTGYLALNRLIRDHEYQKRFQYQNRHKDASDFTNETALMTSLNYTFLPGRIDYKKETQYTFWLAPFGGYTQVQAQHQTPAFNMTLGGITIGWDYNGLNRNFFGIAGAYLYTDLQENSHSGHGHVNQGFLTFYGTLNAHNWYFDLGLSAGLYRSESVRHISFSGVHTTATSHPQGWQAAPSFEIGYGKFNPEQGVFWFGATPFLFLDWVLNWEQKLQEQGAAPLNMAQQSRFCSLLYGETGFRLHEIIEWEGGKAVFREKMAYAYQKTFHTGSLQTSLVGSPSHFTLETFSGANNLGVLEFSLLLLSNYSKVPYLDIWYEGEFGSGYQLHQAVLEIGKNF